MLRTLGFYEGTKFGDVIFSRGFFSKFSNWSRDCKPRPLWGITISFLPKTLDSECRQNFIILASTVPEIIWVIPEISKVVT